MKLEIYGTSKSGWSGHGENEPGELLLIKACPFCGSHEIEVSNTHTPYYTAQCSQCSAEGPRAYDRGDQWNRRTSKRATEAIHRLCFRDAIEAWNERSLPKGNAKSNDFGRGVAQ